MAKDITTLSPEVIRELGEMQSYIERLRRGGGIGVHEPSSRFREKQVRIAKTTTGLDCSSYPTEPTNTYVIELGSGDWNEQCGKNELEFIAYQPQELRYAHDITNRYYEEDSIVLVMLIHGQWYIVPQAGDPNGLVLFKLTTDRTREIMGNNQAFGRASAIVEATAGQVDVEEGDDITVYFSDRLWLGAVAGCEGLAEQYTIFDNPDDVVFPPGGDCLSVAWQYNGTFKTWDVYSGTCGEKYGEGCIPNPPGSPGYDGEIRYTDCLPPVKPPPEPDEDTNFEPTKIWVVKECQERGAWIRFEIIDDRPPTVPDADVDAIIIKTGGFANAVFPIDCDNNLQNPGPTSIQSEPTTGEQSTSVSCSGQARFEWYYVDYGGGNVVKRWQQVATTAQGCSDGCYAPTPTEDGPHVWVSDPKDRPTKTVNCVPINQDPYPDPNPPQDPDGPDPPQPPGIGACVKVRYAGLDFPRALRGAIGYAVLDVDYDNVTNNAGMRYYVVQSDQMATHITATLTAKMCGTAAKISTPLVASFHPFSQTPINLLEVPNPRNHYGKSGDNIEASWNETLMLWEVTDVTLHEGTISSLTKEVSQGCTTLKMSTSTIAVELCEDGSKPETLMTFKTANVTNVEAIRLAKNTTTDSDGNVTGCDPQVVIDLVREKALVACEDSTATTVELDLNTRLVTVDVFEDSNCIKQTQVQLITWDDCGDEVTESVVCAEECEPESGT